ncbi:MAG: glycerol kinase GlpK [Clostridiaceae bacterium]|nr:glycerol kinase GlpK [Clostridiaceae bacterium]
MPNNNCINAQETQYILALDAGTTSSRCLIFDHNGQIRAVAQQEFPQHSPRSGWVEQDPRDIWQSQLAVCRRALSRLEAEVKVPTGAFAALGITNQRETTIIWDRHTGEPIYNAIVWQCRRSADHCRELQQSGYAEMIRAKTGLVIDPYFSASKITWMLDNVPGARERAERGDLLFGTVDTWLIWQLTGGRVHATDVSNASRTMLFNIHDLCWDDELLKIFRVPRPLLPNVLPSSALYGHTDPEIFGHSIPITGVAGDQQGALFGQVCFRPGQAKNTYGTGCFLLMNTGTTPIVSRHGLLTTVAWQIGGETVYALEGSVFTAGAVIQWLRDELEILSTAAESEVIAKSVPDTNGCYLVPAFTGLGAPYWDPYARGAIVGLSRRVDRRHIIRAALESMAYQTCDVLTAMQEDAGLELSALKVDGGAAANNFLLQIQADLINVPVIRPDSVESTARGAAFLAGLAVNFWPDADALTAMTVNHTAFIPTWDKSRRTKQLRGWHRAVARSRDWLI